MSTKPLLTTSRFLGTKRCVLIMVQEHDLPAKEAATGCGSIPAAKKPLVVFVEDTEDVNKEALQNLISVLSEVSSRFCISAHKSDST